MTREQQDADVEMVKRVAARYDVLRRRPPGT